MSAPDLNCPHCGALMKQYWTLLAPGYVRALVKIKAAVIKKGQNLVHPVHDCGLNQNERNNLTKLRFHGMIAKATEKGLWLLTRRGSRFLLGEISVPKRVLSWRNRVIGYDTERVFVKDVICCSEVPAWPERFDFELADPEGDLVGTKEVQLELFG